MSAPAHGDGPILTVEGLSLSFPGLRDARVQVLDGVSFDVRRPETVALVGESGSGKSVTAPAIMGLGAEGSRIESGRILVGDRDLLAMDEAERRTFRGRRIAMIFQSPRASLNPLVKAGEQIARVVRLRTGESGRRARREAVELMDAVGIDDPQRRFNAYPHQLSGGMAQRVMIAMALAVRPELLIADEPTTALDVTIQKQIFDLLGDLQERYAMSVLLITHDLAVVAETSDRVVVLFRGRVVEAGPAQAIFDNPAHPYTRRLVRSILRADKRVALPEVAGLEAAELEEALAGDGRLDPVGDVPGHVAARSTAPAATPERERA
jgi:ABC-type dipeptide/oligopeptide/nickel transport system ATPase component